MVHSWLKMSTKKYFTYFMQNLIIGITKRGISYSKSKVIHPIMFVIASLWFSDIFCLAVIFLLSVVSLLLTSGSTSQLLQVMFPIFKLKGLPLSEAVG
jgi:hypothetical protein